MGISKRKATIMFVDLVGSSEVASHRDLKGYSEGYLNRFHEIMGKAFKLGLPKDIYNMKDDTKKITSDFVFSEVRGDECIFIIARNQNLGNDKSIIREDILYVFSLALAIKYLWLFEETESIGRMEQMKAPFDIAIGINTGEIQIQPKSKAVRRDRIFSEGYAINLTKRIESESRKGVVSNIFVSENTFGRYTDIGGENILRFKRQERSDLKGITGNINTYELIFANLDEEEEIIKIPEDWLVNWDGKGETKEHLDTIEKMFLNTLNPWLGNVICNINWQKGSDLLDDIKTRDQRRNKDRDTEVKQKAEPIIRKAAELARKLIEIDPNTPAWKIYLSQIIFDYLDYDLVEFNEESADKDRERSLLLNDTINLLSNLTNNKPDELDAWLYLGRFYLEIKHLDIQYKDIKTVETQVKDEKQKEENKVKNLIRDDIHKAMDCFQRVIIWDDEYPDADYYLAAGFLKLNFKDQIYLNLENAIKKAKLHGKGEQMKKDARKNTLFRSIRTESRFKSLTK